MQLPVTAAVLAGGPSVRMGVEKALVDVGGQPLVRRVASRVGAACAEVLVVVASDSAVGESDLPAGARFVRDTEALGGPIGGIATALWAAGCDWVFVVGADMPFVESGVVGLLWAARDGVQAVVPVGEDGTEPLLALYHASCLEAAASLLASGERRVTRLLDAVRTAELPVESLREVDPKLASLINVNTAEDLAAAREAVAAEEVER